MDSSPFNFASLLSLVRQYAKLFLIVSLTAIVVGVIISMPSIMQPMYKSTAVVYPVNIKPYSDESETEQLLQYFDASAVRDTLIERFDLYSRYEIKRTDKGAKFNVIREYNDHFVISKTLFESVKLDVEDTDPFVAKAMADTALALVNELINKVTNTQGRMLAESFAVQMEFQRNNLDSIEAAISKLSKASGALDYSSQTRELMRAHFEMAGKGDSSPGKKGIEEMMGNFQESGSTLRMLQNVSYFATMDLEILSKEYLRYRELSMRKVDYIDIVVAPDVADKKSSPIRWLVVAICLISSLCFLTIYIAILRSIKGN